VKQPLNEIYMNRMTTTIRFRNVIATALFGAVASSLAVLPAVADNVDAHRTTVKYGDLNLSNPQGAATLYSRIQAAAKDGCWQFEGAGIQAALQYNGCVDAGIVGAVTQVNNPALSAVYSAHAGKKVPTRLASLQK
jgi:UrcA family protein